MLFTQLTLFDKHQIQSAKVSILFLTIPIWYLCLSFDFGLSILGQLTTDNEAQGQSAKPVDAIDVFCV